MCLSFLGLTFLAFLAQEHRLNDLVETAARLEFSEEASVSLFDLLSPCNRALLELDTLMEKLVNDYFPFPKDTIDMLLLSGS